MAKTDKQRFNFLTALNRQLEGAVAEGDEEYDNFRQVIVAIGEAEGAAGASGDRLDAHAQWLAALEARLEDLEQAVELFAGEEADDDDDGLDDEDMGGDEPGVGSHVFAERRVPPNLGRTGDRQVAGRPVMDVDRSRTYRKVSHGAKRKT